MPGGRPVPLIAPEDSAAGGEEADGKKDSSDGKSNNKTDPGTGGSHGGDNPVCTNQDAGEREADEPVTTEAYPGDGGGIMAAAQQAAHHHLEGIRYLVKLEGGTAWGIIGASTEIGIRAESSYNKVIN